MMDTSRALRHIIRTQEPGIDGTGITTAEKVQLVTDVSATKATANVLSALRFDPAHPNYGAIRDDSSPSARSTNDTAFALAAADAFTAGGTLVIKGTYHLASQLQVLCNVDAASGVLRFNDLSLSPALLVGGPTVAERPVNKTFVLPEVIQDAKTGLGWAGTDTGVEVCRANQCRIVIPRVTNFSKNIKISAVAGGNAYNEYTLGLIENGKINMELAASDGGWTNENNFYGGRFAINSDEGTNIPGARHILITSSAHQINNNLFIKPSVEGNGPEFHVEIDGMYNTFMQARWEASPPRVYLNQADSNVIMYGYGAHLINYTLAPGTSYRHAHFDRHGVKSFGGGLTTTAGNTTAALEVMDAGDDHRFITSDAETRYRVRMLAATTGFKRVEDDYNRVEINHSFGRILVGNGSAPPTTGMVSYGSGIRFDGTLHGFFGKTPVSQPAANPDTSGATLTELETEVNELKAALRALGLIAT